MHRRDFRENKQPLVMIIPMIDIMLFLLVFFMLSTLYMVQTGSLQVNLPQSDNSVQETKPDVTSVTVMIDGTIMYGEEVVTAEKLKSEVQRKLHENNDAVFVLLGDKSARYEKVIAVLEMLKKSGVKHVSIATETKK